MRTYNVALDPKAIADLKALHDYVASKSSSDIAFRYTERIKSKCASLNHAPKRGTKRNDLGPNYRSIGFERSALILFRVDDEAARVTILGVFYRGREVAAD